MTTAAQPACVINLFPVGPARTSPRSGKSNRSQRPCEDLSREDAERVIAAAGNTGRHRLRDRLLCLMMLRHGLRVGEAVNIRVRDLDLKSSRIMLRREKGSGDWRHPLYPDELRLLRRYLPTVSGDYLFPAESGGVLSTKAVWKIVRRAGVKAGLANLHPHQFRHTAASYQVNRGMDGVALADFLGHRNLKSSRIYARVNADRYVSAWD